MASSRLSPVFLGKPVPPLLTAMNRLKDGSNLDLMNGHGFEALMTAALWVFSELKRWDVVDRHRHMLTGASKPDFKA